MKKNSSENLNKQNKTNKKSIKKEANYSTSTYVTAVIAGICVSLIIAGAVYRLNSPKTETKPLQEQKQAQEKQVASAKAENQQSSTKQEKEQPKKEKKLYIDEPPEITAKAFAVENMKTGERIYGKNTDQKLPPASITKIMTALVTLDRYNLNKAVPVPKECTTVEGSKAGFKPYDVFTIEDLLYAMLVKSSADAACTLASIDGHETFLIAMNQKAKALGMNDTHFQNEIGLDSPDAQLSTVDDINKMVKAALKYKIFQIIVGTQSKTITALNSKNKYVLHNTNDLLSLPGTVGIKTGYTEKAGQCLAYLYENKDEEILITVLGSQDRFKDTKALLDWAKTQIKKISEKETQFGG